MRGTTCIVALLAMAAAGSAADSPPPKSKAVFEKACSACHSIDQAVASRRTRDQWQAIIEAMIANESAKISDDEFGPILDYLVAVYGKVNVNRAPADEIAEIAGLSAKEADAIVNFRKANGKFDDFDALSKVPSVDLKKLEKSREAISF